MLLIILKLKSIFKWVKKNIYSIVPSILLIGVIFFHYFFTYNPPLNSPVIISPITTIKTLENGHKAQIKVSTPETNTPQESGFSEAFVRDTIGKILGIKQKELMSVNNIKGKYKDSLVYVKEELDNEKRKVKYYESKDSSGRVIGSGKIVDGSKLVYSADLNLMNVIKKEKGKQDTLVFYDPDQRFTVNQSKEFKYAVPEKTVVKRVTFGVSAGAGVVVPNFKPEKSTFGGYVGLAITYNFR